MEVHARLLVVADDALDTGRDEEVLLNQAHAAAVIRAVIRIQELRDALDELAVLVLAAHFVLRKAAVIREVAVDLGVPEAQRVDRVVVIADNRHIIRHSHDRHRIFVDELETAVFHLLHVGIAVELDVDGLVRLAVLPGKTVLEPVVRNLDLVAVDNLLLEQTVLVADAAAVTRQTMRCHRVDEAGSETAEAAVAEARIRLFLIRIRQIDAEAVEDVLHSILDAEVDEVRLQQASEQELDGEVIDLLFLALHVGAVRLDPVLRDELLRRRSDRLVDLILRQLVNLAAPHDMGGVDETQAQRFLQRLIFPVSFDILFLPCQM